MFLRRKLHVLVSVLILGLALSLPALPAQAAPLTGEAPVISWWSDFVDWVSGLVFEPPSEGDGPDAPPAHSSSESETESEDDRGSNWDPIG
jgi:hypothetical protein